MFVQLLGNLWVKRMNIPRRRFAFARRRCPPSKGEFPMSPHYPIKMSKSIKEKDVTTNPRSAMRAYRVETTLSEDGTLQLKALPFQKGEMVEVIVLARENTVPKEEPDPLRGKVLRYDDPTEPVATDDWEALP